MRVEPCHVDNLTVCLLRRRQFSSLRLVGSCALDRWCQEWTPFRGALPGDGGAGKLKLVKPVEMARQPCDPIRNCLEPRPFPHDRPRGWRLPELPPHDREDVLPMPGKTLLKRYPSRLDLPGQMIDVFI